MSLSTLHRPPCPPNRAAGFTLIELMICVAVVGVLSSIAYPAFSSTLATTRRSDALVALMKVQLRQERFRADHP
ncbi:MAG: prepilin-type N-terminal cleavage/methylation domain-containing protein, partial [Burkholderiaceae bacterium]|nr:prepilin-type N-terminal cleavage/methylation domain-containing protein [Burkholderiaceae bacterium]